MANRTIYDRIELCEEIIDLIENAEETRGVILYSHMGIGKTSVCKKIESALNVKKQKDVIRVVAPQENNNIQEGAFLKNIFFQIKRYYEKKYSEPTSSAKQKYKKYRFLNFVKRHISLSTMIQSVCDNADNLISTKENYIILMLYIIKTLLGYFLLQVGLINKIDESIMQNNKLMSEYIKYVLGSGNIVLNIDNVQNFDNVSLEIFLDCLLEQKERKNFILLEFTLCEDNSNYKSLEYLKHVFENANIEISALKLEKLDIKNVIKVALDHCQNKDELFEIIIKNNYDKLYKGNLKKVEHFASIYAEDISIDIDPTLEKLKRLSTKQLYVLAIIIINNAILKTKILKYILQNGNNDFLIDFNTDVIEFCQSGEFVELVDDEVRIVHSSTIDVWYENIQIFKKYELLAYRNSQTIYNKILHNELFHALTKKECLLFLFKLYSKFEIAKISEIIFQIDDIIYDFLSIEELSEYLKKLIDSIYISEEAIDYLYNIVDICIRFQLYNIAGFCLQKIKIINGDVFSEKYSLYQYIKMFQGEEYENLLELIKENRRRDCSKEFSSYSLLFEIVTYRAMNNEAKYVELVNATDQNDKFKNTIHYAYYLRLAEAYEKRNLAIPKVEESIRLFKKANLSTQVAKSQVSLAFLYAISGRIDDARTELNLSQKILQKNIENKYVFNINKACIHLLSGDFSNEIWTLLDDVENCTHMRFDRIAIIINKLILCIENADYSKGVYLQNKGLELLELESDKHIHAIFYYNCYLLNKSMGNIKEQQYFYGLAYANRKYCETLKARLENKESVSDNTTFLLSKPWHVCFVSYWYFDYLKDLN